MSAQTSVAAASLVRCVDVAKTYGRGARAVVALHGATATVRAGDRIAITGPSGSGKSTLLHTLAGLEQPTAGIVEWPALGAEPAHRPGLIGVVFQGPSLLPPLTVLENVALPLVLAGETDSVAQARALAALISVNISELAPKLPEELSGGQAQRAAVARVLASGPALILADEPTGSLDREAAARVTSVLIAAADELGAALLIATHDPAVASRLPITWQVRDGALHVPPRSGGTS